MCTVTFIPQKKYDFVLTSSRDVPYQREAALEPKAYVEDGIEITYPKDGKAGGTWIGFSEQKRLICLLNGGFENHETKEHYRKSRGLIVLELLKAEDLNLALKNIDLEAIEPFTLVIVEWDFKLFLFEFVWDGGQKHFRILPNEPFIWSSSTLYDDQAKKKRIAWFKNWQAAHEMTAGSILDFHKTAGEGDPKIAVMMDRGAGGTVSITQVVKSKDQIDMRYEKIVRV